MAETTGTTDPLLVQAQENWYPLVSGRAIGIGNALNLDADGIERVRVAQRRERRHGGEQDRVE